MSSTPTNTEPAAHRQQERRLIEHVQRLLNDERLRIDTSRGRRSVTGFIHDVKRDNAGVDLKRAMSEANVPDRELQAQMPQGEKLDVTVSVKKWFVFKQPVGRLSVRCVSPTRALLTGEAPAPLKPQDVKKMIDDVPPPLRGVPTTVVLLSTSGFTIEAHELAERRNDRTVILVEPNAAGGWSVCGPVETKALNDLFDPEADDDKRQRIRQFIDESRMDLTSCGIAADRIAAQTKLPPQLIEAELKAYAKENAGLAAKRLDGRVVLFREGSAPLSAAVANASSSAGDKTMPLLDRMKALFARKGETEKKVAFLAERRTVLSQQRDRAYEELSSLENKENELREEFKTARAPLTKKRVTSQMLQLRKDIERRQQLLGVFNQQIDVVATHLHNLELVQQGQHAKLPDSEEMTNDAAKAEEMLAELQAQSELAGTVSSSSAMTGLSAEEQALYEELEREATNSEPPAPATPRVEPAQASSSIAPATKAPASSDPRRAEPEAG